MRRMAGLTAAMLAATVGLQADLSTKEVNRIEAAATVLREIHRVPDKDIPRQLWDSASCVIVVPR